MIVVWERKRQNLVVFPKGALSRAHEHLYFAFESKTKCLQDIICALSHYSKPLSLSLSHLKFLKWWIFRTGWFICSELILFILMKFQPMTLLFLYLCLLYFIFYTLLLPTIYSNHVSMGSQLRKLTSPMMCSSGKACPILRNTS